MPQSHDATQLAPDIDRQSIELQSINAIRFLSADAVQKAESGHPGTPMALAPVAYVLWTRHLRHNPKDPDWPGRDRFVLSNGHASMLLYSLLHLTGYDLSMEDIKNFRQFKSRTPGHPENFMTPGVETTTGPLGQGFANGVGMGIAERVLAAQFNAPELPVVDNYTYVFCSDGDVMEGVSHEAASLAGHLGLGRLVYVYDDNEITIDGSTDLAFTEDVGARFEAYGWHVQHVDDANDLDAIDAAFTEAREEARRPSLIVLRSHIGYGSPNKQDTAEAHGSPLGEDEVRLAKENLGWPADKTFHVPDEVYEHMQQAVERGAEQQQEWEDLARRYREEYPEDAAEYDRWMRGTLPDDWEEAVPTFEAGEAVATRKASGTVLDTLAPKLGFLLGGAADLGGSNKTEVESREDFQRDNREGLYFRFGVREHAMAGAMNGMVLYGGLRPYGGTFLIFSDYLRPSLRLASLMGQPVTYVFTHDSIGLGEDGPTHQPIEHVMALRAIPQLTLIRPADANETAEAWKAVIKNTEGPTALVLSRQKLPTIDRAAHAAADGLQRGAYVLRDPGSPRSGAGSSPGQAGTPDVILIGTGSEVQHVLAAAETLAEEGVAARVVSMPSWELFEAQEEEYRNEVLPPEVTKRVSMEAGITLGWERYVGPEGRALGIDHFGASAPGEVNMENFGFTAEHVAEAAREVLGRE